MLRIILVLILAGATTLSTQAQSQSSIKTDTPTGIMRSMARASKIVGVPGHILTAICQAESNLNPKAYVFHDGGDSNSAIGLCQVLVRTAEEFIKVDKGCYTDLRVSNAKCNLMDPYINAYVAAKFLKKQYKRYNESWFSAIAAYNTGTLKTCISGRVHNAAGKFLYKCEKGGVLNQKYIDRILEYIRRQSDAI